MTEESNSKLPEGTETKQDGGPVRTTALLDGPTDKELSMEMENSKLRHSQQFLLVALAMILRRAPGEALSFSRLEQNDIGPWHKIEIWSETEPISGALLVRLRGSVMGGCGDV